MAPEADLAAGGLADAIMGKPVVGVVGGPIGGAAVADASARAAAVAASKAKIPFRGLSSLEEPRGLDASVWKH